MIWHCNLCECVSASYRRGVCPVPVSLSKATIKRAMITCCVTVNKVWFECLKGKCKVDTEAPFTCLVIRSSGHKTCFVVYVYMRDRQVDRQLNRNKQGCRQTGTLTATNMQCEWECVFDILGSWYVLCRSRHVLSVRTHANCKRTCRNWTGAIAGCLTVLLQVEAGGTITVCVVTHWDTNVELYLWGHSLT